MFKFYKMIGVLVAGVYVIALAAVPALSEKTATAERATAAEVAEVAAPVAAESGNQEEPAPVQVAAAPALINR